MRMKNKPKNKQYEYLVAYMFSKEGCLTPCSGTTQVIRDRKITSWEDIVSIQELITQRIDGAFNLGVYNFILLNGK